MRATRSSWFLVWRGVGGYWRPGEPARAEPPGDHLQPAGRSVPDADGTAARAGRSGRRPGHPDRAVGPGAPAVFGVSFGGAIALELATTHPERLGALVVQGAESRFRTTLGATIARRVLERFPLPSDNRFVNQFFNLLHGGKPEPGPLVDFVVERCWETDQSIMAQRIALLETFDVSDRLWRIDVPTLVLAGSRDVIVPASRQPPSPRPSQGPASSSWTGPAMSASSPIAPRSPSACGNCFAHTGTHPARRTDGLTPGGASSGKNRQRFAARPLNRAFELL